MSGKRVIERVALFNRKEITIMKTLKRKPQKYTIEKMFGLLYIYKGDKLVDIREERSNDNNNTNCIPELNWYARHKQFTGEKASVIFW